MTAVAAPAGLADVAVEVGEEAAELIRGTIGTARTLGTKSTPTDVVTQTDLAAEDLIRRRLASLTPTATILGEEHGGDVDADGLGWIIDPIDGTVNFLYDLPAVAVSVAATLDGHVVAGAVVDVVRRETFRAHRGGGAQRDGIPLRPGEPATLAQALVITGYSYDAQRRAQQGRVVADLVGQVRDVRSFGSAALHLCWVACGRADAYFETDTQVWDYAAGALIAQEAGARVVLPSRPEGLIVASACSIHDDVMALVATDGTVW